MPDKDEEEAATTTTTTTNEHEYEEEEEEEEEDEYGRIVPVTIITGFLGSGKTTMLNHILNDPTHKMKFAVIENELGSVSIDDKVLSEQSINEEIIEVMNGCLCCTVRGDLIAALKKLYGRVENFDGLIIETTGIADPAPVVQTFCIDEEIQDMYQLDSVITVTDAKYILDRLNEKKEEGVSNESVEQVAFADKIILNKVDLLKDDDDRTEVLANIEQKLRSINPTAPILRSSYSNVPPTELLNIGAFDLDRVLDFHPNFLEGDHRPIHDFAISYVACTFQGELHAVMMSRWLQRLVKEDGANLFRYKGVLAVKGKDEKFIFQGVGMLLSGNFQGQWKDGEIRESRFVFIGKNLDQKLLKAGFEACRVTEDLRFVVGTAVEANCGGGASGAKFRRGKVIEQWDDGNAYRVQLDDDGVELWVPVDIDDYIRAA